MKVVPQKLKGKAKESDRVQSDFRIHYNLSLSHRCCHSGGKRISVTSNQSLWSNTEDGEEQDHALQMKALTLAALKRHKEQASANGLVCHLDYEAAGALPNSEMMWRYLWAYAENEIRKHIMFRKDESDSKKEGHKSRANKVLNRPWEKGGSFEDKHKRYRARSAVLGALELASGKSSTKAADVFYYAATKLKEASVKAKIDFDECSILGKQAMYNHKLYSGMMERAKECIGGMKRRINKEKLSILTSVVALFVLPKDTGMVVSSCKVLGLNHKAKYTKCGFTNRNAFEKFMKLNGNIEVAEMVVCRDGFGQLKEITASSTTICLEPWQYERVYKPSSQSRMARWEPSLDEYGREERSDTTPEEWILAIDSFRRSHNHTSPNTSDPAK